MNLLFEKSVPGRACTLLPDCDVPNAALPEQFARQQPLHLPELSETDISRHYTELSKRVHGVNDGFYPLGSCTMKYNPALNEEIAALPSKDALYAKVLGTMLAPITSLAVVLGQIVEKSGGSVESADTAEAEAPAAE